MSGRSGVTVAIATLDRPEGLARCLDALLTGETLPTEVVVVDQGQEDVTSRIVDRCRGAGALILHLTQERRGLAASRNLAVARSDCPIVAFTDDDCVPDPSWVAAIERAFGLPDPPGGVTGRVLPLGDPAPGLHAVSSRRDTERRVYHGPQAPWNVGTGGNFAAARSWLERVGPFDERLGVGTPGRAGEDMDIIYRLLRAGAGILYEPEAIVYHERQTTARRMRSRFDYGFGMGAFCAAWLRRGDLQALWILSRWTRQRLSSLSRAVGRTDGQHVKQQLLNLRGALAGLAYGARNPALLPPSHYASDGAGPSISAGGLT